MAPDRQPVQDRITPIQRLANEKLKSSGGLNVVALDLQTHHGCVGSTFDLALDGNVAQRGESKVRLSYANSAGILNVVAVEFERGPL